MNSWMWGAIGWSAASWLTSALVKTEDYTIYFKIASGLSFAVAIMTLSIWKVKPKTVVEKPDYSMKGIIEIFNNRYLLLFLGIIFVHSLCTAPLWTHQGLLLERLGASQKVMRMAFGLQALFEIPFFFFADRIIRKFGLNKTLVFVCPQWYSDCFGIRLVLQPLLPFYIESLHGITWSLFWVCCVQYMNEQMGAQWRATGQSILAAIYFGIGLILGNLISGILIDIMSVPKIFLYSGIILLICSLILFPLMAMRSKAILN
ncbi:MAG: MFS transporter [Bacteroidales bacterium]|nr:MFS transporter [Bacteroidales bacterium]